VRLHQDPQLLDLIGERLSGDFEHGGGAVLVAAGLGEGAFNEVAFETGDGVLVGAGGEAGRDDVAEAFGEVASVTGSVQDTEEGLGPRFNSNSCVSCHSHPAMGGSSPATNPQVSVAPQAQVDPLVNLGIISANGPVREVRFTTDGGVHDLFTIFLNGTRR